MLSYCTCNKKQTGVIMAISCKQIAEMAGVSRQAAASVLNGAAKCLVSKDKKEQLLLTEAMQLGPTAAPA